MTLGFSTKWPAHMDALANKPNYFVAKIFNSLLCGVEVNASSFVSIYKDLDQTTKNMMNGLAAKKHTIRSGNRWKTGMKIHAVTGNRTKNRFQFAPTMICTGVQDIEIKWESKNILTIYIDGKDVHLDVITILAINDGFETVEDFFSYFNKDFKGQIIHWTDTRY